MPLRLNSVILLKLDTKDRGNMVNLFITKVKSSLFSLLGGIQPIIVSINVAEEAAEKLKHCGVPSEGLPRSHGGSWSYDRMFEWKQAPSRKDDIAHVASVARAAGAMKEISREGVSAGALYAKRAYRKKKQREKDLESSLRDLKAKKVKLLAENELLEALYEKAAEILALQ